MQYYNGQKVNYHSITIEPDGSSFDVYGHSFYPSSSVLAGQQMKSSLANYEDQLPYMTASLNPFNDKQSKIIASWNKIFPSADYVAIKNYSENAGIEQALIENGILKDNNKMMTIPLEANEKISVNIYWIDLINPINSQELN